ncbi:MFS general substrate transporter [Peniophora sp. CONT]|nr:MFS general substrate transporter [Peniophora sp. CONT]
MASTKGSGDTNITTPRIDLASRTPTLSAHDQLVPSADSSELPLAHAKLKELDNAPLDIEHVLVQDDPRTWSPLRKNLCLFIISSAAFIAGLAANIYNPGINDIERELHATSGDISLSLALFILMQGVLPLFWSVASEIKGRKLVYIISIAIAMIGALVAALAKSIGVLIGMRCFQGLGSSAVLAIGAATLADIYDPAERGAKMGIYYAAPLLGPSLGPILGGILTQYLSWRATFWFLFIWMGLCEAMFLFLFKDTYRKERSLTYQSVLRRRERERLRSLAASKRSSMVTVFEKTPVAPEKGSDDKEPVTAQVSPNIDVEAGHIQSKAEHTDEVKLTLADVNPIPPLWKILRRWNNLLILTSSGLIFGFSYCISYTCARTLENDYDYNALNTGFVLLSYGIGSMGGSILGGRWSDRVLAKATAQGNRSPETRLVSTKIALVFFPLPVMAYGWLAQFQIHIAAICTALFFAGFFSIWIYSSTLAYIVDANNGRSSSAVATNSFFRGIMACIFAEVAVPLQNSLKDGGLYSLWTGLVLVCEVLLLLVLYRGRKWREAAEERERH